MDEMKKDVHLVRSSVGYMRIAVYAIVALLILLTVSVIFALRYFELFSQ